MKKTCRDCGTEYESVYESNRCPECYKQYGGRKSKHHRLPSGKLE